MGVRVVPCVSFLLTLAGLGLCCTERYEMFPEHGGGGSGGGGIGSGGTGSGVDAQTDVDTGSPVPTGPAPTGRSIGAMDEQTCVLRATAPWCWGSNANGAIGMSDAALLVGPTRVPTPALVAIEVGGDFVCGLASDGGVWCWGRNDAGQLGSGDFVSRAEPRAVGLPAPVHRLSAGPAHVCAITLGSELWCWGINSERQLGHADLFDNQSLPIRVGSQADWVSVSAGQGHTCAIRDGGSLYCWGRNSQWQLGLGTNEPDQFGEPTLVDDTGVWSRIAADGRMTCGIQNPGRLYCWGDNPAGQLGMGDTVARTTPTQVGTGTSWREVTVNAFHTCALDSTDQLWCWGRGVEGQLGMGDYDSRLVPTKVSAARTFSEVAAGRFYTCALDDEGGVWCTGDNSSLVVGAPPALSRVNELTRVEGLP
jgi:alpha-tubulin suppressor-like RCC1 family protein